MQTWLWNMKTNFFKRGNVKMLMLKTRQFMEELTKCFISCRHLLDLSCSRRTRSRSRRLWGHSGKHEDSYRAWKTLGHQTQGHSHACCSLWKRCELLPIPTGHGEVAAAQKEGVWLSFPNGGQLSPMGSPLARATQRGLEGGWVFMTEAGISALRGPRGPWARWVGHHCCPYCMYFWSFYV